MIKFSNFNDDDDENLYLLMLVTKDSLFKIVFIKEIIKIKWKFIKSRWGNIIIE